MLEVKNITRIYRPKKGEPVVALKNVSIKFPDKGLIFILGKSGCGKSTFLNILGGLDKYDEGEIIIKGKSSKDFTQADFDSYRNTYLGFIFQEYNILNEFNVGQNIALALELQGKKATSEKINEILSEVDLLGLASRKPSELSGGQKQRIAIARALIKSPEIIMADEPTGALDSKTGIQVFDTLKKMSKEKLVIVVSHDREFAEMYGDRVIEFKDGEVISDIEKYLEDAHKENENISIIDNKIIQIEKGYKLTQKDVELINKYLEKNSAILSVDEATNRDTKKFARINDFGQKESFKETDENEIINEASDFKLIKSRLPLKASIKMGASGLKAKPFRLLMTILLSLVAFSFFGLVDTLGAYNKTQVAITSMYETKSPSYLVSQFFGSERESGLDDDDVAKLESNLKQKLYKVAPINYETYNIRYSLQANLKDAHTPSAAVLSTNILGYMALSDSTLRTMGYSLVAGRCPQSLYEIVISKYHYSLFKKFGYLGVGVEYTGEQIASPEDFISKNITLNVGTKLFNVVGIIDTKLNNANTGGENLENLDIKNFLNAETFINEIDNGLHSVIFVSDEFMTSHVKAKKEAVGRDIPAVKLETNNWGFYFERAYTLEEIESLGYPIVFAEPQDALLDNQILIPASEYVEIVYAEYLLKGEVIPDFLEYIMSERYSLDEKEFLRRINECIANNDFVFEKFELKYKPDENESTTYTCVGCYADQNFVKGFAANENSLRTFSFMEQREYVGAIILANDNKLSITKIMNYFEKEEEKTMDYSPQSKDSRYIISGGPLLLVDMIHGLLSSLKTIFLVVAIIFAVFSSLLLANFMTISISYKKKEIGVLRAIGARGVDVYSVFFAESMIISLINFILSIIVTIGIVGSLNRMIIQDYGLQIALLSFGVRQFIIMLIISIATAVVATFLPVYLTARKKPSEAIRTA